jgi:hypothetical protein
MPDKTVNCEVKVPQSQRFGSFANAFRVIQDAGQEYLLDFLVYSDTEQSAKVVARLRVYAPMLPAIRDRLASTMKEVAAKKRADTEPVVFPVFTGKSGGEVQ